MPMDPITWEPSPSLKTLVVSPSFWNSAPPRMFQKPNFDAEPAAPSRCRRPGGGPAALHGSASRPRPHTGGRERCGILDVGEER